MHNKCMEQSPSTVLVNAFTSLFKNTTRQPLYSKMLIDLNFLNWALIRKLLFDRLSSLNVFSHVSVVFTRIVIIQKSL